MAARLFPTHKSRVEKEQPGVASLFLEMDDGALRGYQARLDGAPFEFVGKETAAAFVQRVKADTNGFAWMAINGNNADIFGVLVVFVPQAHIAGTDLKRERDERFG